MVSRAGRNASVPRLMRVRGHHIAVGLRAAFWMAVARALPFRATKRLVGLTPVAIDDVRETSAVSGNAQRDVTTAMRLLDFKPLGVSCLPRSVALERVLVARRVPADLIIGVDTSQGFRAHAWVEVAGRPVGALDAQSKETWQALGRLRSKRSARLTV